MCSSFYLKFFNQSVLFLNPKTGGGEGKAMLIMTNKFIGSIKEKPHFCFFSV